MQRWGVIDEPTGSTSWVFSGETIGGICCKDSLNGFKA